MENLCDRMHARISASAALNPDFVTGNLDELLFDEVLNGVPTLLALPPLKRGAVISDDAYFQREGGLDLVTDLEITEDTEGLSRNQFLFDHRKSTN